jgi:type II secretory pathway component PulF
MNQDQKLSDNVLLLEHLATAARQQVPLPALVSRLAEAAEDPGRQRELADLADALSRGLPLGETLLVWPGLGRASLTAWLQAAEGQGQLPEALDLLASDLQLQERRVQHARIAMVWPAALLLTAVVVSMVVTVFVLPQFRDAFDALGMNLPAPTQFYFSTLSFIDGRFSLGLIVSLLALVTVVWLMFNRSVQVDRFFHRLGLEQGRWELETRLRLLPVMGAAAPHAALPQYLRYLMDTTPIPSIRQRLERVVRSVEAGEPLAVAVEQENLFPATLRAHLDVAQRTDNLPTISHLLAQQLHEQWTLAAARFERKLTLVVYILSAWVAFGLLIAVYLPIFKLGQAI